MEWALISATMTSVWEDGILDQQVFGSHLLGMMPCDLVGSKNDWTMGVSIV